MVDDTDVDRPSSCREGAFSALAGCESRPHLPVGETGRCHWNAVQRGLWREQPGLVEGIGDDLQLPEEGRTIRESMTASRVLDPHPIPVPTEIQHLGEPGDRIRGHRHVVAAVAVLTGLSDGSRRTLQPMEVRPLHEGGGTGGVMAGAAEGGVLEEAAAVDEVGTAEAAIYRRLHTTQQIVEERAIRGVSIAHGRVARHADQPILSGTVTGVTPVVLPKGQEDLGAAGGRMGRARESLRLLDVAVDAARGHLSHGLPAAGHQQREDQNM